MIELWDGYMIAADTYQYVLGKPTERKRKDSGTETFMDSPTYHPSLGSALQAFYKMKARESIGGDVQTLSQAIAAASQIENRIRSLAGFPDFTEEVRK